MSLLVSDCTSLVKASHSLLLLALVDSSFVECVTLDTLVIYYLFLEGLLRILGLVYVFRLFDVGCDSRSVVFSDLCLHDNVDRVVARSIWLPSEEDTKERRSERLPETSSG